MLTRISRFLLIRKGEQGQVLYFFLIYLLLGCGMAFGRNSSNVLFLKRYGIEYLPAMYMTISVFLAFLSTIYASFADRLSPERLSLMLFSSLVFLVFGNWVWISFSDVSSAYPFYFLLYEIASEIIVIHAAHYVSQNFDPLQAKRLFPLILAGNQIGIIIGSLTLAGTAPYIPIQNIPLAWCVLLLVPMVMIVFWHRRNGSSFYFRPQKHSSQRFAQAVSQVGFGFVLLKKSPLLRAASFALFFMVIAFYVLSYSINEIYTTTMTSEAQLTRLYGIVNAATNTLAMLLQIFVTNRVIQRFGVKKVHMVFPLTTILSYLGLLASFSLAPAIAGSFNKKAIFASFRNPLRSLFFNTLPDNVRGRARATSLTLVLPLALFTCGGLLITLQDRGNPDYYLGLGLGAAVLYLFFNLRMNRSYVNEMLNTLRNKLLITNEELFANNPQLLMDTGKRYLGHSIVNRHILKLFELLIASQPEQAQKLLLNNASQDEVKIADQMIRLLAPVNPMGFITTLRKLYRETEDTHLQASIFNVLFYLGNKETLGRIPELLQSQHLRLRICGIAGALHSNIQFDEAISLWKQLTASTDLLTQMSMLELLELLQYRPDLQTDFLPPYRQLILSILQNGNADQVFNTLEALKRWPGKAFPELAKPLLRIFQSSDTRTRVACVRAARLFYQPDQELLKLAIEDSNDLVRHEAARLHYIQLGKDAKDVFVLWLSTEANGSPRAQSAYLNLLLERFPYDPAYEVITRSKVDSAEKFFASARVLASQAGGQSAAHQVLIHVLLDRMRQYIDLALCALRGAENAETLDIVRSGINSNDPRHVANACEILRDFGEDGLGKRLSNLVDGYPALNNYEISKLMNQGIPAVLAWCRELADPWLNQCAIQALKDVA